MLNLTLLTGLHHPLSTPFTPSLCFPISSIHATTTVCTTCGGVYARRQQKDSVTWHVYVAGFLSFQEESSFYGSIFIAGDFGKFSALFAESSLTSKDFFLSHMLSFGLKNNEKTEKKSLDVKKRQWFIAVKPFVYALMISMNKSIFNNSRSITSFQTHSLTHTYFPAHTNKSAWRL